MKACSCTSDNSTPIHPFHKISPNPVHSDKVSILEKLGNHPYDYSKTQTLRNSVILADGEGTGRKI